MRAVVALTALLAVFCSPAVAGGRDFSQELRDFEARMRLEMEKERCKQQEQTEV